MASLYIKDAATADRASRIAERLGTTKTAMVNRAFDVLEQAMGAEDAAPKDFVEWLRWHRARNPLPPTTGVKADKAFYDWLCGEEDVDDVVC